MNTAGVRWSARPTAERRRADCNAIEQQERDRTDGTGRQGKRRLHRHRHDGPGNGPQPPEGRSRGPCLRPQRGRRRRRREGWRRSRATCGRCRARRRHRHHDAARHAPCRGGGLWRGRSAESSASRQADRGHEHDLAGRGPPHPCRSEAGRRQLHRCARVRRPARRQERGALDHGRRRSGSLRQGRTFLQGHGHHHHPCRRFRRRTNGQALQSADLRHQHPGDLRSARFGPRLRRRPRFASPRAAGRLGLHPGCWTSSVRR